MVVHLKSIIMLLLPDSPGGGYARLCGALYSVSPNTPMVSEVCDYDGSKLVVRDDDRPEVVAERLKAYDRQTTPVLEYFRERGIRGVGVRWRRRGRPQAIAKRIRGDGLKTDRVAQLE